MKTTDQKIEGVEKQFEDVIQSHRELIKQSDKLARMIGCKTPDELVSENKKELIKSLNLTIDKHALLFQNDELK